MQLKKTKVLIYENCELLSIGLKLLIEQSDEFEVLDSICDELYLLNIAEPNAPNIIFIDMNSLPPKTIGVLTKSLKDKFPNMKVLIFGVCWGDRGFSEFLNSGADGFCLRETLSSDILLALRSLQTGAVWIDKNLADSFKTNMVSKPVSEKSIVCACERHRLSTREAEVLTCIKDGCSNGQIARKLCLSPETVKTHIKHIFEKLSVKQRTEAVMEGLRRGLINTA